MVYEGDIPSAFEAVFSISTVFNGTGRSFRPSVSETAVTLSSGEVVRRVSNIRAACTWQRVVTHNAEQKTQAQCKLLAMR